MTRPDCPTRKVRYRDRISASVALATTKASRGSQREETRAYRCPACRGWHLTSHAKREGA